MYISRVCTRQEEFLGLIWQEFFYMQLCFTRQRKTERYEQPSKVHFFGWPAGGLQLVSISRSSAHQHRHLRSDEHSEVGHLSDFPPRHCPINMKSSCEI